MDILGVLQNAEYYHGKHIQVMAYLLSEKKDFFLSDDRILAEQKLLLSQDSIVEELIASFEGKTDEPLLKQIWNAKAGISISNTDTTYWGLATVTGKFKQVSANDGEISDLRYIHLKVSEQQEYFFQKGGMSFQDVLCEERNLPIYSLQDILDGSQDLSERKIRVEGWVLATWNEIFFATDDRNVDDKNSILLSTIDRQSEFWKLHLRYGKTSVRPARFINSYPAQIIGKFKKTSARDLAVEIDSILLKHISHPARFVSVWRFVP